MTVHYWSKKPGNCYQCGWCGLVVSIPRIVLAWKSIKETDDNFDITMALLQEPKYERGSLQYQEIMECSAGNQKRIELNEMWDRHEKEKEEILK